MKTETLSGIILEKGKKNKKKNKKKKQDQYYNIVSIYKIFTKLSMNEAEWKKVKVKENETNFLR